MSNNYIDPIANCGGVRGARVEEFIVDVMFKLNETIGKVNELADSEGQDKLPFRNITFLEGEDVTALLTRINTYINELKGETLVDDSIDAKKLKGDIPRSAMDVAFREQLTQIETDLIELASDLESGLLEKEDKVRAFTFKNELEIGENLNNVVENGIHTQSSGESALPALNYPINRGGSLLVFASGINSPQTTLIQCTQMYITNSNDEYGVFTRTLIGENTWGAWVQTMNSNTPIKYSQLINVEETLFNMVNPVGTIRTFANDVDPNTLSMWHGTWVEYAQGRVLVGYDSDIEEFNNVGEIGGVKDVTLLESNLPVIQGFIGIHGSEHGSMLSAPTGVFSTSPVNANNYKMPTQTGTGAPSIGSIDFSMGGGLSHENLQPYIVVKHWRRLN